MSRTNHTIQCQCSDGLGLYVLLKKNMFDSKYLPLVIFFFQNQFSWTTCLPYDNIKEMLVLFESLNEIVVLFESLNEIVVLIESRIRPLIKNQQSPC